MRSTSPRRTAAPTGSGATFYQLVAYSRHQGFVQKRLQTGADGAIELSLVYPATGGTGITDLWTDESFFAPLSALTVQCPRKAPAAGEMAAAA